MSGLYKSVPPLRDLFNMAGMDLPTYLGKGTGGGTVDGHAEEVKPKSK
jgi:flotillin